jgi:uncharacterized OB-fold protein
MSDPATKTPRALPRITEMNRDFWCGGADGQLHILRCEACGTWIHPYAARCPKCRSDKISPQAVSGLAEVVGFTVNVQPWMPGVAVPYVVAIVQLPEQADLRLVTNLPRIPIGQVRIGLPVKVYFEAHGDIHLPLFEAA